MTGIDPNPDRATASGRKALLLVLLTGLTLRLIWVLAVDAELVYDAEIYMARASDLVEGRGFPNSNWPIGYPGFLAGLFLMTGQHLIVAQVANLLLAGGTILALSGVASRFGARGVWRVLPAALFALHPNMIVTCSFPMPEPLYVFLFALGFWLWVRSGGRAGGLIASGMAFGVATLVRSQSALIPAALALGLPMCARWSVREVARRSVIATVAVLVVVSPWLIRNYNHYGQFVFVSTNGAHVLLLGNNPHATGKEMPFRKAAPQIDFTGMSEMESMAAKKQAAVEYIKANPGGVVKVWPAKLWYTFRSDLGLVNWVEEGVTKASGAKPRWFLAVKVLSQLYYMILMLLAFFWVVRSAIRRVRGTERRMNPVAISAIMVCGYLTALCVVFMGGARYHVGMMPWIYLCAASCLGLIGLPRGLRKRPETANE